jgi:1-deoxy-D-xylulose-5-phosphate reductoisomerase
MGTQVLQVIDQFPDLFEVELLSAYSNSDLLIQQALQYKPNVVVIIDDNHYLKVKSALEKEDCKVFSGLPSLVDCMTMNSIDMAVSCIVGIAGLAPVYTAIENKIPIALANKETLVVAGELMMQKAKEKQTPIIPVDSEHSAIFQCLIGEQGNAVEKIILTASGGPFLGKTLTDLEKVTCAQALQHPNWNMGNKITIDSATLMNKGLEVIEAKWLFNMDLDKIEVIVHPQSIIHSLVQFTDGSVKAQLGLPDMKLPIQYALTFPHRLPNPFPRFSFTDYSTFTFEKPDTHSFPCLALAYQASKEGGNKPCVLNAANEVAVSQFLKGKIKFTDIHRIIEEALVRIPFSKPKNIEEYLAVDEETRLKIQK